MTNRLGIVWPTNTSESQGRWNNTFLVLLCFFFLVLILSSSLRISNCGINYRPTSSLTAASRTGFGSQDTSTEHSGGTDQHGTANQRDGLEKPASDNYTLWMGFNLDLGHDLCQIRARSGPDQGYIRAASVPASAIKWILAFGLIESHTTHGLIHLTEASLSPPVAVRPSNQYTTSDHWCASKPVLMSSNHQWLSLGPFMLIA